MTKPAEALANVVSLACPNSITPELLESVILPLKVTLFVPVGIDITVTSASFFSVTSSELP